MDRNSAWALATFALVAVGFAWGRRRGRSVGPDGRRGRPWIVWLIGGLIGFPVIVILLAKLFDSAVLGWTFGLSLMVNMLLVPCALLVAIGYGLGRSTSRRAALPVDGIEPTLAIRVDRDTVHASDDGDTRTVQVDPRSTLATLLRQLQQSAYLPSIYGGEATWVVTTSATGDRPVAVMAQQWAEARLVVPDVSLGSHFLAVAPVIRFAYLAQCPPESALDGPPRRMFVATEAVTASRR